MLVNTIFTFFYFCDIIQIRKFGLVVIMKLDYKKDFKDILKNLRLKKGYSQRQITETLGISLSAYTKYEQGKYTPSLAVLLKICKFFEVELNLFLNDNEANKTKDIRIATETLKQLENKKYRTKETVQEEIFTFFKTLGSVCYFEVKKTENKKGLYLILKNYYTQEDKFQELFFNYEQLEKIKDLFEWEIQEKITNLSDFIFINEENKDV